MGSGTVGVSADTFARRLVPADGQLQLFRHDGFWAKERYEEPLVWFRAANLVAGFPAHLLVARVPHSMQWLLSSRELSGSIVAVVSSPLLNISLLRVTWCGALIVQTHWGMLLSVPGASAVRDRTLPGAQPITTMEPSEDAAVWGTYWSTAEATVPAVSDLVHPGSMMEEFTTAAAHDDHLDVPPPSHPHDLWSPLSSTGVCHRGGPSLSEDLLGLPRTPPLPGLLSPSTSEIAPGIGSSQAGSCTEGGGSSTEDTTRAAPQHSGEARGEGSITAPTQPVNDAVVHMTSLAKHFHVPRKEAAAGNLPSV